MRDIWRIMHSPRPYAAVCIDDTSVQSEFLSDVVTVRKRSLPHQIAQAFNGHEQFLNVWIYIHGSWGDGSNIAFSDFDDLIIYSENKYSDNSNERKFRAWLNKVDMRFCRLDPLQHHGHWILSQEQLLALDESYMPIKVLDGALCIRGPESVHANICKTKTYYGIKRNLLGTVTGIEQLFSEYQDGRINLYRMKCLVGSVLLTPAYMFQINGMRVSKKWAIEHAGQVLAGESLDLLHTCELIRKTWSKALSGWRYCLFKYSPFLFMNPHAYRVFAKIFAPRFQKDLFPILRLSMVQTFLAQSKKLIESEANVP